MNKNYLEIMKKQSKEERKTLWEEKDYLKVIPSDILEIGKKLNQANREAFLVGGSVRDLLLGVIPKDWDIATNAQPKEILKIFPDSFYENCFGTVGVKVKKEGAEKAIERVVEVTTYRSEANYFDKRHPQVVNFVKRIEDDLKRRDFTINALAIQLGKIPQDDQEGKILDLFGGKVDLKKRIIRAVGEAEERFKEDALRMMRAIRFLVQLSSFEGEWKIDSLTFKAIKKEAKGLSYISRERIRDELEKIFLSGFPAKGIDFLVKSGLMAFIIPEILETIEVKQNRHHYFGPYNTVYSHMLASLEKCPSKKLEVRLAAFLHDIGKPQTKKGEGQTASFYNHEYLGAEMTERILKRLKFPQEVIKKTTLLVRNHMFYYNVAEVGEAGVRRIIKRVGRENINDLIDLRIGDRLGSGVPKAIPYRLRHFKFMVEKLNQDPLSVKQLKINGNDLIKELNLKPGPKIGAILEILLAKVIDDPKINQKEVLLREAKELSQKELEELRLLAKRKIQEEKEKEEKLLKRKYWIK